MAQAVRRQCRLTLLPSKICASLSHRVQGEHRANRKRERDRRRLPPACLQRHQTCRSGSHSLPRQAGKNKRTRSKSNRLSTARTCVDRPRASWRFNPFILTFIKHDTDTANARIRAAVHRAPGLKRPRGFFLLDSQAEMPAPSRSVKQSNTCSIAANMSHYLPSAI